MKETIRELIDDKIESTLVTLFNNEEKMYLREISRESNIPASTTYRILNKLEEKKLVEKEKIKRMKLYKIKENKKTKEIRKIFEEETNLTKEFIEKIKHKENIQKIYTIGDENNSEADILIIGKNINEGTLKEEKGKVENNSESDISYLTVTPEQFKQMDSMNMWEGNKKLLWEK